MEDKTIITLVVGCLSMALIAGCYMGYLFIMRPASDGVIFASVVAALGAIAAGILGFHFGKSGDSSTPAAPTTTGQ